MPDPANSMISRVLIRLQELLGKLLPAAAGPSPDRGRVVVKMRPGLLPGPFPKPDELDRFAGWRNMRLKFGVSLTPVFSADALRRLDALSEKAKSKNPSFEPADFGSYFYADVRRPRMKQQRALVQVMLSLREIVADAYVDRPAPEALTSADSTGAVLEQRYRRPAPEGIDADYANTVAGGDGNGQHFVDFERGWTLNHQDLVDLAIPCHGNIVDSKRAHGTAVLGIVCGQNASGTGCRGIVPKVEAQVYSFATVTERHGRLREAVTALSETGGTLLIETQAYVFVEINNQVESLEGPLEANTLEYDVIRTAAAAGITIVEAAGNGKPIAGFALDLDNYVDPAGRRIFDVAHQDFRDSGAILVSAARAPTGTGVPRTRIPNASHGQRVDCFAWGEHVESCWSSPTGAVDLYTWNFGQTSGAAAIVAGAAVALRGAKPHLDPAQIRALLRDGTLNTPKDSSETTCIGVMPNLAKLV